MRIKHILLLTIMAFAVTGASAQDDNDKNLFNHLSVGVTAGTPGIGADVACPTWPMPTYQVR